MRKLLVCLVFSLTAGLGSYAQNTDSLGIWASMLLDKKWSDEVKLATNQKFIDFLTQELEDPATIDKSYSHLSSVSVKTSQDKNFRIFSWFVLTQKGYQTFGLFQTIVKKNKKPVITVLRDQGPSMKQADSKSLGGKNWFGALYYDMIPFKINGKKYHMLLGYNPGNGLSHKKVIEVVQVMSNGQPRFGAAVFEKEKKTVYRYILEYDARAKVSLRYNEKKKMVVFDHLSPLRPEFENQFDKYVPDMSYDGFELSSKNWLYVPDVPALNTTEENGNNGTRLIIDGINDQGTLERIISGDGNNK